MSRGAAACKLLQDLIGIDSAGAAASKRFVEQVQRLRSRPRGRRGSSGFFADLGIDPAGGDRDQLLVQPGGAGAVEAEPAEQDDAGDGVRRLGQAGPGEIVVDEALGGEAAEQPLDDAVLQVQVDDVVVQRAGVLEDDGADRRVAAPFPELLVALAGRAERVHRVGPGRIGALALVEGGELEARRAVLVRRVRSGLSGSAPSSSRAQEMAERKWSSSRPMLSCDVFEQVLQTRRSAGAGRPAARGSTSSSSSTVCRWSASRSAASISCSSASMRVAADAALAACRSSRASSTWDRLPSSFLIVLGLADQDGEDAVLGALVVDEVMAEDLGLRLELAVDAAVALLHAARVPRHVEVEQVPAVGLEVRALRGRRRWRSGCAADACLGSALKACLIASRSSGGVGPW